MSENTGIIQEFLASMKLRGCSPNTLNGYALDLRQFFKAVDKEYDQIDFRDVNSYFRGMVDKKAVRTIARKMASVRAFYSWCLDEECIVTDPTRKLKAPKLPKRVPKYLTIEEINALIEAAPSLRDKAVIWLLYTSGLRISEMYALNRSDMNWEGKSMRVVGKGDKERLAHFSDDAKAILLEYLATRDDDNPALFVEKGGERLSRRVVQKMVKGAAERVGINKHVTPHTMRHTFASHLTQQGVQLQTVSKLLGHSSTNVTEIYSWLNQKQLTDAYESVFDKNKE
jgi:integrase/recombinase XerD